MASRSFGLTPPLHFKPWPWFFFFLLLLFILKKESKRSNFFLFRFFGFVLWESNRVEGGRGNEKREKDGMKPSVGRTALLWPSYSVKSVQLYACVVLMGSVCGADEACIWCCRVCLGYWCGGAYAVDVYNWWGVYGFNAAWVCIGLYFR